MEGEIMTIRFSITMSDITYDTYLKDIKGNRSEYIEKLVILGSQSIISGETNNTSVLMKLIQEKENLERELDNLKLQNNGLKSKFDKNQVESDEDLHKKRLLKAMIRAGVNH
jgi:hypothetical protein